MSELATIPANELARSGPSAPWFVPTSVEGGLRLAKLLFDSGLVPDSYDNEKQVFAAIIMGAELGINPARATSAICVVKGKPSLYAEAMVGLVKASGACAWWRVVKSTDEICVIETQRIGTPEPERVEWTIERAKRLGAGSGPQYKLQPGVMLRHRAESELARMVYSDVVGGMYTPDEIATMRDGAEPDTTPQRTSLIPSADALPRIGTAVKQIPADPPRPAADVIEGEREAEPVRQAEPAKAEASKAQTPPTLSGNAKELGRLISPLDATKPEKAAIANALVSMTEEDIGHALSLAQEFAADPDHGETNLAHLRGKILEPQDAGNE